MKNRLPTLAVAALLATFSTTSLDAQTSPVHQAQELIDAERPEQALALLDRHLKKNPKDADALLLRSTARFMTGDLAAGRHDLERSLELDPAQRQGWLNLAALAVTEERYDDALEAFGRAERLDPRAPENDLNIGTVELLAGDLQGAAQRFGRYLGEQGNTGDGFYLVASNYAMAGYEALAVEHLRQAIERNERARLRARTDPNFSALETNPRFAQLLASDLYRPPIGAHGEQRSFGATYDGGRGPLLPAVLDALQLGDRPFDPRVEVADRWALIWGDLRIKLSDAEGRGVVELSAPAESFTPAEWTATSDALLRRIAQRAAVRSVKPDKDGEGNGGG
jgi:tetratricopeptide (TPR) repeat protein